MKKKILEEQEELKSMLSPEIINYFKNKKTQKSEDNYSTEKELKKKENKIEYYYNSKGEQKQSTEINIDYISLLF